MNTAYHHGDLEEAVIKTAKRLLERDGAAGISIRTIAKDIGVSHQAPYRHFQSREHLLATVRARGFHALAESAQGVESKHPRSAKRQLELVAQSYVSHALEAPQLYQLMFGCAWDVSLLRPEDQTSAGAAFNSLASIIQQKPPPFTAVTIERAQIFWAALHGISTLILNGFMADQKTDHTKLVRSTCRSLSASWFD